MRSKTVSTQQIDDVELAVDELLSELMLDFDLLKNTVGILFCYSDMDIEDFIAELTIEIGFEIIGCSCIASAEEQTGFHEMAVTLMVLTADDCQFKLSLTGDLNSANLAAEITAIYQAATLELSDKPKLIYAIPPYNLDIAIEEYIEVFNQQTDGIPVIGGIPSCDENNQPYTILNQTLYTNNLVMLSIFGNIRPLFGVENVLGSSIERKRKITKVAKNIIYEVGHQRLTDYIGEIGLPIDKLTSPNATLSFLSNPLLIENAYLDSGESLAYVRSLFEINTEEGWCKTNGDIPLGATLSICSLNKEDIVAGATLAIRDIREKIKAAEDGYEYNTLFIISCIGRNLLMLPKNDAETKAILEDLPENMTMAGFYSCGELGPMVTANQKIINVGHNQSLVLCVV